MAIGTCTRTIAAAVIILVSATPAAVTGTTGAAQDATTRAHGSIGGWQVHSVGEAIVIVSPDRCFATVGRLYSASGADIGGALTGRPSRPLDPATIQAASATSSGHARPNSDESGHVRQIRPRMRSPGRKIDANHLHEDRSAVLPPIRARDFARGSFAKIQTLDARRPETVGRRYLA
ncbi:MAG: hypothetical protein OXE86_18555 [Alphaproteobacteria bacterium]|nr:hypothetical protein [Alphaproteobacteria bacterium]